MVEKLGLQFVDVDGCAVGVSRQSDQSPILKPWRFAVSSQSVADSLKGYRCDGSHAHAQCEGADTARTAYYPQELCEALHRGLDAHEHAASNAAVATSTTKPRGGTFPGQINPSVRGAADARPRRFDHAVEGERAPGAVSYTHLRAHET